MVLWLQTTDRIVYKLFFNNHDLATRMPVLSLDSPMSRAGLLTPVPRHCPMCILLSPSLLHSILLIQLITRVKVKICRMYIIRDWADQLC